MTGTVRSYYGQPVVKPPTWKAYIPAYVYCGGLAAGSSLLAAGADVAGDSHLASACRATALASLSVGAGALVADLGKPSRFHHMLRVFRPSSPMNIGSWLLAGYGPAVTVAAAGDVVPALRPVARAATWGAAALAPAIATYTAVLVGDTAVPAWHDVRDRLPFLFASSAAAAAGGVASALVPGSVPAQRLATAGATSSSALAAALHHGLPPEIAHAYETPHAKRLRHLALAGSLVGAALVGVGRRSPRLTRLGGVAIALGALAERFAVFAAGRASAAAPEATIGPQRARRDAATSAVG